ncbi:MAG: hypothetical protein ACJ0G7_09865 [Parasynechococcus sp.]|uniref:hypothetical protein n=1 Tax=Parasynechococcus sp. TaxID=3101203 RepID=UPI003883FB66
MSRPLIGLAVILTLALLVTCGSRVRVRIRYRVVPQQQPEQPGLRGPVAPSRGLLI